jgi:hypothetical protein
MAKKPEPPPPLFWLTYRPAGVVVVESRGLLHARLMASLAGANRGFEFAAGQQLDPESAGQVPANMIGRLLDDGDLRKLHRMLIRKKPPAPSVRRQPTTSARSGNADSSPSPSPTRFRIGRASVCRMPEDN